MGLLDITPELIRQYAAESKVGIVSNDTIELDPETGKPIFACPIGVIALHNGLTYTYGYEGDEIELSDAAESAAGAGWITKKEFQQRAHLCFVQGFDAYTDNHTHCYRAEAQFRAGEPTDQLCAYFEHGRKLEKTLLHEGEGV